MSATMTSVVRPQSQTNMTCCRLWYVLSGELLCTRIGLAQVGQIGVFGCAAFASWVVAIFVLPSFPYRPERYWSLSHRRLDQGSAGDGGILSKMRPGYVR